MLFWHWRQEAVCRLATVLYCYHNSPKRMVHFASIERWDRGLVSFWIFSLFIWSSHFQGLIASRIFYDPIEKNVFFLHEMMRTHFHVKIVRKASATKCAWFLGPSCLNHQLITTMSLLHPNSIELVRLPLILRTPRKIEKIFLPIEHMRTE